VREVVVEGFIDAVVVEDCYAGMGFDEISSFDCAVCDQAHAAAWNGGYVERRVSRIILGQRGGVVRGFGECGEVGHFFRDGGFREDSNATAAPKGFGSKDAKFLLVCCVWQTCWCDRPRISGGVEGG
jgi:hypothetical protein